MKSGNPNPDFLRLTRVALICVALLCSGLTSLMGLAYDFTYSDGLAGVGASILLFVMGAALPLALVMLFFFRRPLPWIYLALYIVSFAGSLMHDLANGIIAQPFGQVLKSAFSEVLQPTALYLVLAALAAGVSRIDASLNKQISAGV